MGEATHLSSAPSDERDQPANSPAHRGQGEEGGQDEGRGPPTKIGLGCRRQGWPQAGRTGSDGRRPNACVPTPHGQTHSNLGERWESRMVSFSISVFL